MKERRGKKGDIYLKEISYLGEGGEKWECSFHCLNAVSGLVKDEIAESFS